jgi:hypothetical protein
MHTCALYAVQAKRAACRVRGSRGIIAGSTRPAAAPLRPAEERCATIKEVGRIIGADGTGCQAESASNRDTWRGVAGSRVAALRDVRWLRDRACQVAAGELWALSASKNP